MINSKAIILSFSKVKVYLYPFFIIVFYFIFSFPLNRFLFWIWDFLFAIIPIIESVSIANQLILFIGIIYILYSIYRLSVNFQISKDFYISFLLPAFLIYCYYRFVGVSIVYFYHFYSTNFYYADIILLIFLFESILLFRNYIRKIEEKENNDIEFIEDIEWNDGDVDILQYNNFAVKLAELLLKIKSKNAIGVGIVGKWGEGKSSFINMMKPIFNNDNDTVFIDFDPWTSSKAESITIKFFNVFSNSLSPFVYNNFKYYINRYSKSLISVDKSGVSGFVSNVFSSSDTEKIKLANINSILRNLDKKIIIVIDNLDRLDNIEIVEILKIIRNTANFRNTIFIAAYDREYIQQAINHINPYNKEEYLEKIFTLEYPLPKGVPSININLLQDYLIKRLPDKKAEIKSLVSFSNEVESSVFEFVFVDIHSFIPTIRDVKRFVNSFILDYRMGGEDLHFSNFFFLELFRYKLLGCYNILKKEYTYYLKSDFSIEGNVQLGMVYFQTEEFCKYLKNSGISEYHIHLSQIILPLIFKDYTPDPYKASIVLTGKTYRYFTYKNIDSLPVILLKRMQTDDFEGFQKSVDAQLVVIENNKRDKVKNEIHNALLEHSNDKIDSKDKLEAYFRKLIYISGLFQESFINTTNNLFTEFKKLKDGGIIQRLYNDDLIQFESFIRIEFDSATFPYNATFILNNLIRHYIYNPKETEFFITREEALGYCESYFKKYLETKEEVGNHTFEMYHCCIQDIDSQTHIVKLTSNASIPFKKFIIKYPARFIELLIRPEVINLSGEKVKTMVFYPFIHAIFESYNGFEKFLQSEKMDDISNIDKVRLYWNEFKERNYKNFVIKDEDRKLLLVSD